MAPIPLSLLPVFVTLLERGSYTQAAAALGVPRSTVSRAITALEAALRLTLFQRSTRVVKATAEALALYEQVAPAVATLQTALVDMPAARAVPAGLLRLSATPDLATAVLAEVVSRFSQRYPAVQVELLLTVRSVDLVRERVDFALRVSGKRLSSSGLVAQRVGSVAVHLYASPKYLAAAGMPGSPEELALHPWIGFRGGPHPASLFPQARQPRAAKPSRIVCDDMLFARECARQHAGIAALSSHVAEPDLLEGTLVRVLPKLATRSGSVFLVQPRRSNPPARVTLFRAALLEHFARRPLR